MATSKRSGTFGPKKKALYLQKLREGLRRTAAAKAVGITTKTIREHAKADPEFAAQIEQAEIDAVDEIEDVLYEKALGGHFQSIIFVLMNRRPEKWQDKRNTQPPADTSPQQTSALKEILERLEAQKEAANGRPLGGPST